MSKFALSRRWCPPCHVMVVVIVVAWQMVGGGAFAPVAAQPPASRPLVELTTTDGPLHGTPQYVRQNHLIFLLPDGSSRHLTSDQVTAYRVVGTFEPLSPSAMRLSLTRAYPTFEVVERGALVVAAPKGRATVWAARIVELEAVIVRCFRQRGLSMPAPEFPLAMVVHPSRTEFLREAEALGEEVPAGLQGFYLPRSNRVHLVETPGQPLSEQSLETVLHEATHQIAFNRGLHQRFADTPAWVAEGLAQLFERPSTWGGAVGSLRDRTNFGRLGLFQNGKTRRPRGWLATMLTDDGRFTADPQAAYAESWAVSFYLAERASAGYAAYLNGLASRPVLTKYESADRIADFARAFGADLGRLEADVEAFADGIWTAPSR